jgi:hypothetical protein
MPTCNAAGGASRERLDEEYIINRQEMLAAAFRDRMTEGQSVQETGQSYRQKFFQEVTDLAEDVSYALVCDSMLMESCKFIQRSEELRDEGQYSSSSAKEAGESLVRFISLSREVHHAPGSPLPRPLVILASPTVGNSRTVFPETNDVGKYSRNCAAC